MGITRELTDGFQLHASHVEMKRRCGDAVQGRDGMFRGGVSADDTVIKQKQKQQQHCPFCVYLDPATSVLAVVRLRLRLETLDIIGSLSSFRLWGKGLCSGRYLLHCTHEAEIDTLR